MLELRSVAKRFELRGCLVQSGIIDGVASRANEAQVSQVDASKMTKLAVLRNKEGAGLGGRHLDLQVNSWPVGRFASKIHETGCRCRSSELCFDKDVV